MTTAHRPTWNPCRGGPDQGGTQIIVPTRSYSSKDLPGYLQLKNRQKGQDDESEVKKRDFKKDLLEREYEYNQKKQGANILKGLTYSDDEENDEKVFPKPQKKAKTFQDTINMLENQNEEPHTTVQNPFPEDEDDADFQQSDDDEEVEKKSKDGKKQDEEDSDDEDEDDDEILMKEFQRLKQQKEQDEKLKAQQKDNQYENNMAQEILKGNPLLEETGNYSLNKRWYEETVFKNQAKIEKKEKKRFINDNVRNEFHYKFMGKYIWT